MFDQPSALLQHVLEGVNVCLLPLQDSEPEAA